MSSTLSKRQLARNEKLLQDLVQSVPGNNKCADCHMPNPAWASWSLGVFLCMRCAAIHRKLGTHISKVKSLNMDSWSNEQVDNMRKVGNVASNQIYNPGNKKPAIPIDVDEADSAMERFIRHKYVNNVPSKLDKPRSPLSDEGTPPPLPPKNSSKFGFRSASSIFPLSSRAKREAKMAAITSPRSSTSPGLINKPSQVFGATIDFDGPDGVDRKLARLRNMGFFDDQRNAIVLKGVNGSVERAIEALTRLGEGGSGQLPSPRERPLRASRSLTPLTKLPASPIGLSVPLSGNQERPTTASTTSLSSNPVNTTPLAQPQTAHSTGSLPLKTTYNHSWIDLSTNPFGQTPQQPPDAFSQAFEALTLSTSQHKLFPQCTGDIAPQGYQAQPMLQQNVSPSAPTSPYYIHQPMSFHNAVAFPQPELVSNSNNPFLAQPMSPSHTLNSLHNLPVGTSPTQGFSNNPFMRSPVRVASPALGQIPEQGQSIFASASSQPNPFFTNLQTSLQYMGQQPTGQAVWESHLAPAHRSQPHVPQQKDNASIMALYDQPHEIPKPSIAPLSGSIEQPASASEKQPAHSALPARPLAVSTGEPRTMSQPLPGNLNPFMSSTSATAAKPESLPSSRHINRDSMNLGMDMAWNNGRHSPDAFASLSARHV